MIAIISIETRAVDNDTISNDNNIVKTEILSGYIYTAIWSVY